MRTPDMAVFLSGPVLIVVKDRGTNTPTVSQGPGHEHTHGLPINTNYNSVNPAGLKTSKSLGGALVDREHQEDVGIQQSDHSSSGVLHREKGAVSEQNGLLCRPCEYDVGC